MFEEATESADPDCPLSLFRNGRNREKKNKNHEGQGSVTNGAVVVATRIWEARGASGPDCVEELIGADWPRSAV